MTADEAKATLSKSEMYDIRPSIWVDLKNPEDDLLNLQQGTLHGLCMDPETGYADRSGWRTSGTTGGSSFTVSSCADSHSLESMPHLSDPSMEKRSVARCDRN